MQVLYTVGKKAREKLNRSGIYTVRDIQARQEEVIRLLGRQGQWVVQQALGRDDRRVVAYRGIYAEAQITSANAPPKAVSFNRNL